MVLAGLSGGLLFLYFLVAFVNIWIRTQSFTWLQIVLYFGTPALELLALTVIVVTGRRRPGWMARYLAIAVWLANALNIVLGAIGFFGI